MIDLDHLHAAIANGDADAFARWLSGSEATIRESLRSFARVVDVEAILQEALVRVWQVAPRFTPDGRPHALVRFSIRIARNLAISEVRRMKVHDHHVDEIEMPEVAAPDPMLREAIEDCREKLPAKPRAALEARLAAAGAREDEELAAGLAMSRNTFLQNFTRARKFLVDCLGKRGITL